MRARNSHITINKKIVMNNEEIKRFSDESFIHFLENDTRTVFTTYDLGCSTALLCAGFELLSVEKSNPQKALFVFNRKRGN